MILVCVVETRPSKLCSAGSSSPRMGIESNGLKEAEKKKTHVISTFIVIS